MDLKKRGGAREKSVSIDGETLVFTYRPGAFTPALLEKFETLRGKGDTASFADLANAITDILLGVLISWDLTDGAKPVPVTKAGLREVPLDVLQAVLTAVNREQSPNP